MNSKNEKENQYSAQKRGTECTADKDPLLNTLFFNKYKVVKKLGEGSFGKVYKAVYDDEYFALKLEDPKSDCNLLEQEATIIKHLQGPNIPKFEKFGNNREYNILVMELLDKSLDDILTKLKTFSVKTTAMIGYQIINILKNIHDKHIIHRDVKPDNMVMGRKGKNADLYIVDFGLSKKYRSSRTLKQLPLTKKKSLTGTARYASINALNGLEQSRRDDLESAGYSLMYFLRGNLPWQNIKIKNKKEKYKKIMNKKKEISSEELGKNFPIEFAEILDHFKNLDYTEEPNYEMCCDKMSMILQKGRLKLDFVYDWTTERNLRDRKKLKKRSSKKLVTLETSNKKESKNTSTKYYTNSNYIEKDAGDDNKENNDDENEDIEIEDLEETEKEKESDLSNKANIDDFDSPGVNDKNTTECCLM